MIIPQLPKDIVDTKQMQDFMGGVQKSLQELNGKPSSKTLEIATQSEAQSGSDNTKVITPLSLRQGLNANGSAPVYACRAWVNFNGTLTGDMRTASGNVSSITDGGVGIYTVNFTTPMEDVNYAFLGSVKFDNTYQCYLVFEDDRIGARTVNNIKITTGSTSARIDSTIIDIAIFR